jgi:methylated-DNA-protein-cysteine methyltransferase-like protein
MDWESRVIAAIRQIPRGKVSTYGAIARAVGSPNSSRQVARVLSGSRGLPWHRVLGADGHIRVPGEWAAEQRLQLQFEGVRFRGRRVDMVAHEFKFGKTPRSRAHEPTPKIRKRH